MWLKWCSFRIHFYPVCERVLKSRLPCWPLYSQQVSHQRWISGIHCTLVTKHASEGSILALKPSGDVTRSPKQGYQWPHEKDMSSKNSKKKKSPGISFYRIHEFSRVLQPCRGHMSLEIIFHSFCTPRHCTPYEQYLSIFSSFHVLWSVNSNKLSPIQVTPAAIFQDL